MVREQADQQLRDRLRDQGLEANEIRARIALVGQDTETVAAATARRRTENELIREGIDINGDLAQRVIAGAEANARLQVSYDRASEAAQRLRDAQREVASEFSSFISDILVGGQKIGDAFANLSKNLSSNAIKAVLTGEGPLAAYFGTASADRGRPGGLLGGNVSLSSLFGGSSSGALQGPTETGATLDQASGSYFGNLFDTSRIERALSVGSEKGFMEGIGALFSSGSHAGGVAAGGLGGGSLMQGAAGLALIGSSYSIGQQSPGAMGMVGGVASGAMGGFMLGNMLFPGAGGAIGAVLGAGAGAITDIPPSKKDPRHVARQRLRHFR